MKTMFARLRNATISYCRGSTKHIPMLGATAGISSLGIVGYTTSVIAASQQSQSSSSQSASSKMKNNTNTGNEDDIQELNNRYPCTKIFAILLLLIIHSAYIRHRWRSLKIFSGTANEELASQIANLMGTQLSSIKIGRYADGEIAIQILENVRGKDVYIVQPTCPPGVNDNLMELILLISTMRRASAHSITAVLPYYGYARQDRKMRSRVPISAADVAKLLESVGVDRVVAVDLHCGQIQGFFGPSTPCDNLDGSITALEYFASNEVGLNRNKTVVVSPDAGGVYRAKQFREGLNASGLNAGLAMIIKQREAANKVSQMDLVGDVDGCDCIIVDDMIDTAGTLCKAGNELKKRGAKRIYAFATHGLFSGPAIERINNSCFEKVVVLNTIPMTGKGESDKILQLSVAQLLAKAIESIHFRKSISQLFRSGELQKPVGGQN